MAKSASENRWSLINPVTLKMYEIESLLVGDCWDTCIMKKPAVNHKGSHSRVLAGIYGDRRGHSILLLPIVSSYC